MFAKQMLYLLSQSSSPFCSGYFGDGISGMICPGCSQTVILPISASITGVSQLAPADYCLLQSFEKGIGLFLSNFFY
jgi:hypothetical protein